MFMQTISNFLAGSSPGVYCFIFFGKLVEVALGSLRTQLILKGQRLPGAVVAAFEYTFWLCITASALTGFSSDPVKILVLVVAFSLGNVLGSILEARMALGYCSIVAIFMDKAVALDAADQLRASGQALTLIPAEGLQGAPRTEIHTTVKRKDVARVKQLLFTVDPQVVVSVQDIQQVKGARFASTFK